MTIEQRIYAARELLSETGIDCLILTPSSDMEYLIGYRGRAMERPTIFFLSRSEAVLLTPVFEMGNIPAHARRLICCIGWSDNESPYEKISEHLSLEGLTLAICNTAPSFIYYHLMKCWPSAKWVLADPLMIRMRSVKDQEEINYLRNSNILAGKALIHLLQEGIEGKSELETAERLRTFCQEEGLSCDGYGIVASGPNSALPHHHAGSRIISYGDPVVIDFGGSYKGYQSDMTRTVCVGEIPDGFQEIYQIVLLANQTAKEATKPGVTYESIDQAARSVIAEAGYDKYFTHRNGHGIGLDGHEHPYIVKGNREITRVGNVFSNEPGIYIEGKYGVRIEDIIAVTKNGCEVLTNVTREIQIVN